jgi:ubiquinone/menaquinone biosynthesis C-methylase UbiE
MLNPISAGKLKEGVQVISKKDLFYVLDERHKPTKHKPWLGDMLSFLYDRIMEKSVFPKKFHGDIRKHFEILKNECSHIHGREIVEIATGSGNVVRFMPPDNAFTCTDISAGLLRAAVKSFKASQIQDVEFYVADAAALPFADRYFDVALCHLSMNFFPNVRAFIGEVRRVLKSGGVFYGSVPVPERKDPRAVIHGKLYTESEFRDIFENCGFAFVPKAQANGALLYFEAGLSPGR